ncbi:hypothetical protein GGTG_12600 [Gaeumannomyces tritici R3-111a-1]|uniref:Ketosynthase family 3 (KS3) domain-containing protein n=1 Tax=Gaeumannomyces tritici (strain R3-111a-1) TaxID=644352 RepID=J3PGH5_GAET3|nr:hypothetical protein GGTG_12600 [Gaeumannomyces tritici R3-111a-1]EJT69717.1 hypothetical protein GGTG_12600 [Gaeumannomyces tritici R3-111a-1]
MIPVAVLQCNSPQVFYSQRSHDAGHSGLAADGVRLVRRCGQPVYTGSHLRHGLPLPLGAVELPAGQGGALLEMPERHFSLAGHYQDLGRSKSRRKPETAVAKHGYFLDPAVGPGALGTSFYPMPKSEIEQLEPQAKQLLEVARECLGDAGEVGWRGTKVGAYVGSFSNDWYDLHNKGERKYGMYRSAIVGGTSIILAPALTTATLKQGGLSTDGSCKTLSAAANGYARSEAILSARWQIATAAPASGMDDDGGDNEKDALAAAASPHLLLSSANSQQSLKDMIGRYQAFASRAEDGGGKRLN